MLFHILSDFTRHLKKNLYSTEFLIVLYIIISRVFLLVLINRIVYPNLNLLDFINVFAKRWDGNSYTFIAQNWYTIQGEEAGFIVFPPLYPTLIKLISIYPNSHVFSAFLLSNVFYAIASAILYRLLLLDYSKKFAIYIVFLISIFPTSYFFSAAYPESLLLLLFSGSFLLARKGNYAGASILAGLATITRPFGISLWPALLFEWFIYTKRQKRDLLYMLVCASVFSLSYLGLNYLLFANPFAFHKFLSEVWQKSYSHFWIGIWQSWKRGIYTKGWGSYKLLTGYSEAIASTLAFLFFPLSFTLKLKVHLPYLIYLLVGIIMFTSTGFILSAPRYLLSLPPFFIIFAYFTYPKLIRIPITIIFVVLFLSLAILFAQGRWAF